MTLACTAGTGLVVLGAWLTRSDVRRARVRHGRHRRLPPALVFGHVGLAVCSATAWVIFVLLDRHAVAAVTLALLAATAVLGFTMFFRWFPTYRPEAVLGTGPGAAHRAPSATNLPITVVVTHGCFAVVTAVLVTVVVFAAR